MTQAAGALVTLKLGDSVGGYMLTSHLGSGPAAYAYKAQDAKGHVVALRALRSEFAAQADWVEHFHSASAALAQVPHPCLGKVYDTGIHEGVPFVVEEFLSARHLIYIIFNDGIRQDQAVRLLMVLADLAVVCQEIDPPVRISGIRPTDVFLCDDGSVRVCHCGVLKSPHIEAEPGPMRTSVPPGQCMAPEVMAGLPPDDRSDVYSIGQIFLRTLRGNYGTAAILRELRRGADIERVIEDVEGAAVDRVLRRCLRQCPEDRYQNAAELLDAALALRPKLIEPTPVPVGLRLSPVPRPVPSMPPAVHGAEAPAVVSQSEPSAAEFVSAAEDAQAGDAFGTPEAPSPPVGRRPMRIRMWEALAPAEVVTKPSGESALLPTDARFYERYPAPRLAPPKRRRRMPGAFARAPS